MRPRLDGAPAATRVIIRDVARDLALGGKAVTPNDGMDLHHAVVPSSYCDLVLLDRYWRNQIESCASCAEAGLSVHIAKVCSKQRDGVERFLVELENGAA
jgi:hypothetical protein